MKKFEGLGFRLKEDEGTDVFYPWFSKIKYQKKRGDEGRSKIVLDLHPEVTDDQCLRNRVHTIESSIR